MRKAPASSATTPIAIRLAGQLCRRFILADAKLRKRVETIIEGGETRDGIPNDDIRAAVLYGAGFDRPDTGGAARPANADRPTLIDRFVRWLFGK